MNSKFSKLNNGERAGKLSEYDVTRYLDEYFANFEQNQDGCDTISEKMNSELVKCIIGKFEKIFRFWDKTDTSKSSDESGLFGNMRQSVLKMLITDLNRPDQIDNYLNNLFTLECKKCGEAFPLRNQNCSYSYNCHKISEIHRELVVNLNTEDDPSVQIGNTDDIRVESDNHDAYDQLFILARCLLCSEDIKTSGAGSEAVISCVRAHLNTTLHRNNRKIFHDNKESIEEVSVKNNVFNCKVCDEDLFVDELVQHLQGKIHMSKIHNFGTFNDTLMFF